MVRINNGSNAALKDVLAEIEALTAEDENVTRIGGYGLVVADLADLVAGPAAAPIHDLPRRAEPEPEPVPVQHEVPR